MLLAAKAYVIYHIKKNNIVVEIDMGKSEVIHTARNNIIKGSWAQIILIFPESIYTTNAKSGPCFLYINQQITMISYVLI